VDEVVARVGVADSLGYGRGRIGGVRGVIVDGCASRHGTSPRASARRREPRRPRV